MSPAECPHHTSIVSRLEDHEMRLRAERDAVLKLEMEVHHMQETLDALLEQMREIRAAVDSLASTRTYVMGGLAVLGVIYGLAAAHGAALLRALGLG